VAQEWFTIFLIKRFKIEIQNSQRWRARHLWKRRGPRRLLT